MRGPGACRWPLLVSATLALAAVLAAASVARSADARRLELRERRVEMQRFERRARRLGGDGAAATLLALAESRDALRVRLVEALGTRRAGPDVAALRHRVEERTALDAPGTATLRLSLEGRIAHGATLLALLGAVHDAARPWPTETRGCLVQRLGAEPAGAARLTIDCVVDILHWSGLDAPGR